MQVDDLHAIAERVDEIAVEVRTEFDAILRRQLLAHFGDLPFVPNDEPEMPGVVGVRFLDSEHREKLMLADLEERVTLAFVYLPSVVS